MSSSLRFEDGFHALETQNGLPFRWMTRAGRLALSPSATPTFVELWVRCHFNDLSQRLEAVAGEEALEALDLVQGWNHLSIAVPAQTSALSLQASTVLPLEFHPGDGRELALQVRPPVRHGDAERHRRVATRHVQRAAHLRAFVQGPLDPLQAASRAVRFGEGFYYAETGGGQPFRWMGRRGHLTLPPQDAPRHLELPVFSAYQDLSQTACVRVAAAEGEPAVLREFPLDFGWNPLSLALPRAATSLDIEVDVLYPPARHPGDQRELTVQVRAPLLHADPARHAAVTLQQANRVLNRRELLARVTRPSSTPPKLGIDPTGRCNVKPPCVYCEWDRNKGLEGTNVDAPFDPGVLRMWGDFYAGATELVSCSIGEPFMMKEIDALLDSFGQAGKLLELTTNGQILTDANIRKLLGRPINLYISIDAATAATYARLRNDRFDNVVDNVRRLIDAKGGPGNLPLVYLVFMPMRANVHEADAFVALCADLQVDRLVLRPLNAAEGAALVWDRAGYHYDYQQELLPFDGLVRVSGRVAEMCRQLGVPLSDQMSFGGEIGARFGELYQQGCAEALQALAGMSPPSEGAAPATEPSASATNHSAASSPAGDQPPASPAPPEEAGSSAPVSAGDAAAEAATPAGLGEEKLPLCIEPWTSLYILRRGVFPCCYGGAPVAPMDDFQRAWNSPLLQEIRAALAAGRFHHYCFDSPDCPIVRKASQHRDLSWHQRLQLTAQRTHERWKRDAYGWPGRLYRGSKRVVLRNLARVARALRLRSRP